MMRLNLKFSVRLVGETKELCRPKDKIHRKGWSHLHPGLIPSIFFTEAPKGPFGPRSAEGDGAHLLLEIDVYEDSNRGGIFRTLVITIDIKNCF